MKNLMTRWVVACVLVLLWASPALAQRTSQFVPPTGGGGCTGWVTVPYNALDFTAGGSQTWTVEEADLISFKYCVAGKVMHVVFSVTASSVGGTPHAELVIAIPGGFTATGEPSYTAIYTRDAAGGPGIGMIIMGTSTIRIFHTLVGGDVWTATTDTTRARGGVWFQIQ